MASILKSTVLSVALLTGAVVAAQAQSVTSLPPAGSPADQSARSAVTSATQSVVPRPGGGQAIQEEHFQPTQEYDANKAQHPYSTQLGPKAGSHSSGQDQHYQATESDNAPAKHPYTSTGTGPRPN